MEFDSRGMDTRDAVRNGVHRLFDADQLAVGERVIFTSGDHMEHEGATNTLRLVLVGDAGSSEGLGDL